MKIINVNLNKKIDGFAIGKSKDGELVYVINGDLITLSELECAYIMKKGEIIYAEIFQTYGAKEIIEELSDSEGLINSNHISIIDKNIFAIKNKWVFPVNRIKNVLNYIYDYPELWRNSKMSLVPNRVNYFRAKSFGITFQKAIEKLNKSGFTKARFYCEKLNPSYKEGAVAEMLANTYIDKNGLITIEVWQGVEDVKEVFYAHGLMDQSRELFIHFDCAIIDFDIKEKELLFSENTKIKSGSYRKLFRIDGHIKSKHIFELANRFFPLDNLIDEYFSIDKIE